MVELLVPNTTYTSYVRYFLYARAMILELNVCVSVGVINSCILHRSQACDFPVSEKKIFMLIPKSLTK